MLLPTYPPLNTEDVFALDEAQISITESRMEHFETPYKSMPRRLYDQSEVIALKFGSTSMQRD